MQNRNLANGHYVRMTCRKRNEWYAAYVKKNSYCKYMDKNKMIIGDDPKKYWMGVVEGL